MGYHEIHHLAFGLSVLNSKEGYVAYYFRLPRYEKLNVSNFLHTLIYIEGRDSAIWDFALYKLSICWPWMTPLDPEIGIPMAMYTGCIENVGSHVKKGIYECENSHINHKEINTEQSIVPTHDMGENWFILPASQRLQIRP